MPQQGFGVVESMKTQQFGASRTGVFRISLVALTAGVVALHVGIKC